MSKEISWNSSSFLDTSGLTCLTSMATIAPIYVDCHMEVCKEIRQEEASAPGMKEMDLHDRLAVEVFIFFPLRFAG